MKVREVDSFCVFFIFLQLQEQELQKLQDGLAALKMRRDLPSVSPGILSNCSMVERIIKDEIQANKHVRRRCRGTSVSHSLEVHSRKGRRERQKERFAFSFSAREVTARRD